MLSDQRRSPSAEKPRPRTQRPRVLVIDDDIRFGTELSHILALAGFPVHFHRSPFGTLSAIQHTSAEIVLLDVNMPRLDGAVLARMIRDVHGPARVKVLLCSEMHPNMLSRMAQRCGAFGAVPKDDGPDGVLRALDALIAPPTA
ncbi:response regulator [Polyangium aurulentum]|uniref:response regulator n=1 Tax=Polyangium aurulentum TaxID=2567896 RepID=UPI0010AE9844|nr:response regulator [Polyangium aurulentum]UQA62206.1 response regulator [Polyangium aurulentum]